MEIDIDEVARAGYMYAAQLGGIPKLECQLAIDAFNCGISNFNIRNNANAPKLTEGMKSIYVEGSNNGCADKELAIVGA